MQWRKRRKLIYIIGSGRRSLLMKSLRLCYPDEGVPTGREDDGSCNPRESPKDYSDAKNTANKGELSDFPVDGRHVTDNRIITGCYVNGLWLPIDIDTSATFYPVYPPPTLAPLWPNGASFGHLNVDRPEENVLKKNRNSSPYWASSYLTDNSNDLTFVPYLYPGYTFGPSVYSPPLAEFPLQDVRREKKRSRRKSVAHELRQIKPGVDAISTPSCDVIRYAKKTEMNANRDRISVRTAVENVNDKPANAADIADALNGNNPTSVIPDIEAAESVPNSDDNNVDSARKMDEVKTVSRFKVYPCPEDTLKVRDAEEKTEVSASPQSYYNYSDSLLRETELELNKLNKKAFQANQAIYQLAYDESVTDEDSRPESRADVDVDTAGANFAKDELPEDLRDPPGSRMEIEVHEMDTASEAGSEDVEIIGHRYETSVSSPDKHVYVNKLSLAAELLRTKESLPYDNEFKRLVNDDTPTIQLNDNKSQVCRADSGVQSEESGDEAVEEIKNPIIQREEMWSSYQGRHYRRQVPNQVPYLSTIQRNGPFSPCLCCIIM